MDTRADETDVLFQPARIGSLELKNRIVMAPMTRAMSPGGIPGPNVARYYGRRAENDVGLIITEGSFADGGRIVNISSGLARVALPGYAVYGSAKAAAEVLTRFLAKELGGRKISVNVVAPGGLETDFGGGALRDIPEVKPSSPPKQPSAARASRKTWVQ